MLNIQEKEIISSLDYAIKKFDASRVEDILKFFSIEHISPADSTNLPIQGGSVDLFYSNLVLIHIPVVALEKVISESYKVLTKGGMSIHKIRMHDEFAKSDPHVNNMNFLRFSTEFWDKFGNSRIKHLNRLRCSQFKNLFDKAGFELIHSLEQVDQEALADLKNMKISKDYDGFEYEDLATTMLCDVWKKINLLSDAVY